MEVLLGIGILILFVISFIIGCFAEGYPLIGIITLVVVDIILKCIFDIPLITVFVMSLLRKCMFLVLALMIFISILIIAVLCFNVSFEGVEIVNNIIELLKYYVC